MRLAAIPRKLYAYIEKKLYEQPYRAAREAAEVLIERREEAVGVKSPGGGRSGGRGGPSNRVQDGVLRVIDAEETLETANRWAFVYMRLSEIFAGTETAEIAQAYYAEKKTAREIAAARGCDRQTIRKRRDEYVIQAALLAAEHGLVKMSDYTGRKGGTA